MIVLATNDFKECLGLVLCFGSGPGPKNIILSLGPQPCLNAASAEWNERSGQVLIPEVEGAEKNAGWKIRLKKRATKRPPLQKTRHCLRRATGLQLFLFSFETGFMARFSLNLSNFTWLDDGSIFQENYYSRAIMRIVTLLLILHRFIDRWIIIPSWTLKFEVWFKELFSDWDPLKAIIFS